MTEPLSTEERPAMPLLDYYTNEDGDWWIAAEGWADRADALAAFEDEHLTDMRLIPAGSPVPEVVPCDSQHEPGGCHCPEGAHWNEADSTYVERECIPAEDCPGRQMLACWQFREIDPKRDKYADDRVPSASLATQEADTRALRDAMTFDGFSEANRTRCESPEGFRHPLSAWSASDWFLAMFGEFGEAANVEKKLNRIRDGIPGNKQTEEELRAALADEIADGYIYLDLLAQSQGIHLPTAVASKFDRKSEEIGYPVRLAALTPKAEETPRG